MPLSAYGLCEAEITAARSKPPSRKSSGAAGVGRMPPSATCAPAEASPAAIAASSISPDSRVSRMTSARGASRPLCRTAARPSASASDAVTSTPARPRTPSVPNSLRATCATSRGATLALGELRPLARLLQAGLLALLGARIAREKTASLELAAEVGVSLEQGPRDAVAQRAGLGRDAAPVQARGDVHLRLVADRLERLADRPLERLAREELLERTAVDRVAAGAGAQRHARDRRLALARGAVARVGGEVDRDGLDRPGLDDLLL